MPVVLLSIDGSDTASSTIQKVSSSLGGLGSAMDSAQGKSAQYEAASLRNEAALLRLSTAQSRYSTLVQSNADAVSRAASAQDAYQTALARQTSILSALSTGTISTANATGLLADANTRVSSTYDAFGSAADGAARSTQQLESRLASLKTQQAAVITAQERLNTTLNDQPVPKDTTGGGTGGGGGHSYLLQAAGYTAAYAAYSAVSQSLGRDATYSRLLGSTAAMTGLTPAESAALDKLTTNQAASGTQPYNRTTLLQGDYSLASLGIGQGNASTISQVESIIAKGSAASGAADTSIEGDTITTLLAAYGLNTQAVVGNTQKLSDQLTIGVKLGKVDMPGFAAAAGGPVANMAKSLGISTADVVAAIAAESVGGIASGQLGNDTYALLRGSAVPTIPQRREAAALGIQYDSSFWGKNGIAGGSDIIEQAMQRQGITGSMQVPVLTKLLGQQDAANAFLALQAGNVQGIAPQVAASAGATMGVVPSFTVSLRRSSANMTPNELGILKNCRIFSSASFFSSRAVIPFRRQHERAQPPLRLGPLLWAINMSLLHPQRHDRRDSVEHKERRGQRQPERGDP